MTYVPAARIADQARAHLGENGPLNTCMSNGPEEWCRELGLPTLGTASVSEAVRLAKAGYNGYRYHDGTEGLARGNIGVWTHEALRSNNAEHVCVVDHVDGAMWRGIGSGTPSGTVARQPESGGLNPKSVLRGYIIAPTETVTHEPAKPVIVKAPLVKHDTAPDTYMVKRGDTLIRIATKHHTTVPAILKANPAKAGKSSDFHILRANFILVGQKIRIPG